MLQLHARVGALGAFAILLLLPAAANQFGNGSVQIKRALMVPDPLPALAAETHGRFEPAAGVVAERVTYSTQFGMRVPAILYLPKQRSGKVPALVVVNGHGGDKYSWYAFYAGVLYASAGAAVLTYDPAGEGERNSERKSGTRAHDKLEPSPELGRRMGGLMMTDVMQAVSYLSQRAEVDPARIGAMGYSMGSFVLGLTCAVEPRLKACVLAGGGNFDGPNGYWDNSKPLCQGIPYRSLEFLGDRGAALYALRAGIGPTLVINGREDEVVAMRPDTEDLFRSLQKRAAEIRGSPKGMFDFQFIESAGHRPYFITKPAAMWLERQLDFPRWTEASIRAMPEIRIGDWAAAQRVELDPLYARDHREGGTPALAAAVPSLTREQLSVFSRQQWEARKSTLVLGSWVEAANERSSIQF